MESDSTRSLSGSLDDYANSRAPHQSDLFDYQRLEPAVRAVALEAAAKIKLHGRRAAESIVAIGEELMRVKAALPHGAWLPWLEAEFGWTDESARKFMRVAEYVGQNPTLLEFQIDVSALYLLARPSTPEPVRDAAIERAATGERVSHGYVRDLVDETRERLRGAFSPPRAPRQRGSLDARPDGSRQVSG